MMDRDAKWPGGPTYWLEGRRLCVSIPFTWNLHDVKTRIFQRSSHWDNVLIGGPAVRLVPEFFSELSMPWIRIGQGHPDALAHVNPKATRTMEGCVRNCGFCAVKRIEPVFRELSTWKNLPIVIDNNLLACSKDHFDKVIDGLKEIGWADFNQGLDSRLLTDYHAQRIAEIQEPMCRLALDSLDYSGDWERALGCLLRAGVPLANIRSYALVGFDSDPKEAWCRCNFIESYGIKVLPMWFHELDALKANQVTEKQKDLGWSERERNRIMQWFYKHRDFDKPRRR